MQHQTNTRSHNPPLPFTREAIIGHYQHHATNGPAYVQIQATNALARIMGLFKQGKDAVQNALDSTVEKAKSPFHGLKFNGWGAYAKAAAKAEEEAEDDEEAAGKEEGDVP